MNTTGRIALLVSVVLLAGCAATGTKFPSDVQQSYRHHDMRRMQTDHLKVYYPAGREDQVRHIASRLEGCFERLEAQLPRPVDWGPVPVFLPEVEFNNAYAAYGAGNKAHMVVPTFFTANLFGQFGYTPSGSAIGCHEMVHYVHLTQIHGFYRAINRFFGPTINPQVGLDLWFFEGLATYYESQLIDGVGRFGSPIWENAFAAGITETHLDGGRLSHLDRAVPYGAHYLIGSHFVGYLVDEYGEEKLWELVDRQGSSLLFPFDVSGRFQTVYGASLTELIRQFEDEVRSEYQPRQRPDNQNRMRWLGRSAELEVGQRGQTAVFYSDVDAVATIEVFDEDDRKLLRRELPDLLPGRQLVGLRGIEALRFSPDGNQLYFIANHGGRDHLRTSLMRLDIDDNRLETLRDDIRAVGGDITADGTGYVIARADGDRVRFDRLDLAEGGDEPLFALPAGAYVAWVRLSDDDSKIAATLMEDESWTVAVFDADDGELLGRWSTGQPHRPAFDPYWLDDDTLLFATADEDRIQLVEGGLDNGEALRHTDVPYMAFNPRPDGEGGLKFLNRDGWGWSLDHIESPAATDTDAVAYQRRGDGDDADEQPSVTGYTEPQQTARVHEDEPYSMLDGLFIPRLRTPAVLVGGTGDQIEASLGLAGRDELGFHNWMINARWNFGEEQLSGSAAYFNTQLAPWTLSFELANEWMTTLVPQTDDPTELTARAQRDRFIRAAATRPWYDIPVSLEVLGADFLRERDGEHDEQSRRLVGAEVGSQYRAARSSAYGGSQWLVGLTGQAGGYPTMFGSDFSMAHLRGQLDIHTPLPFSDRHRLRLSGRARSLPGAPDDEQLIRVGGFDRFSPLFVSSEPVSTPSPGDFLPQGFLFVEPLRGYEDIGMTANHVAIADIDYRYPVIVDRGSASALRVLPSVFLNEFDIQLFGSAATRMDGNFHASVGASIDTVFHIWRLPMRVRNQLAHRLVDDRDTVFNLSLGIGF